MNPSHLNNLPVGSLVLNLSNAGSIFTGAQMDVLKRIAKACFMEGNTYTEFARTIAHEASVMGVYIPSDNDFYHRSEGNDEMNALINHLGFIVTQQGICLP